MKRISLAVLLAFAVACVWGANAGYGPLNVPSGAKPSILDLDVHLGERDVPMRIYLPVEKTAAPVVLFSHGLGGSRQGSAFLGQHWAARGYVAVFMQHPGSDISVWQDKPLAERMAALTRAANLENFMRRVEDVHAVLDQLERWNTNTTSELHNRLNMKRVGMSGHSFGAITSQAVSGQHFPTGGAFATDSRIKAAIMFSPSSPRAGEPKQAFADVTIPWLLMTGTKDTSPIGREDVESRLAVFPALPAGNKYELVLYNAEHSAFTDRALPSDKESRSPKHHRAILALSTAFWDAFLQDNAEAKRWLDGDGPRSILEKQDRWQIK